jgi:hypothetical protein
MRTSARIGNIFHRSADREASRLEAIRAIVGLADDPEVYDVAAASLRVLGASEEEIMVAMIDFPMKDR